VVTIKPSPKTALIYSSLIVAGTLLAIDKTNFAASTATSFQSF